MVRSFGRRVSRNHRERAKAMARYWDGRLVRLRGIEPGDENSHYLIDQEDDISRLQWVMNPPVSRAATRTWVEQAAVERPKGDELIAQIVTLVDGTLVGGIATHHCDRRVGVFSYGLHIEAAHRGRGYAKEAICLILRYYFQELRYQKCNVEAMAINVPSRKLHEALGYHLEGRRRRTVFTSGRHSDMIEYGITVEEFREHHSDYWRED
jgi:RimJ/RimL family protein N-acetyltransferase